MSFIDAGPVDLPRCSHGKPQWACEMHSGGLVATRRVSPTPFWHAFEDDAVALAVLTSMACPAPCVGYVNDTGWHLECERKAREALATLRGPTSDAVTTEPEEGRHA